MIRKLKLTIPFILLIMLFSLLGRELYSASPSNTASMTGAAVPAFRLPNLFDSNKSFSSSSLKGKVVLLNVFASWCSACNAEHAMLMHIKDNYHVPIYGILYRDNARDAIQWLNQKGNPYVTVGNDPRGDVAVDLGIYGTPETFVISPQGRIIYRHLGVISQRVWDNDIYPLIKQYEN